VKAIGVGWFNVSQKLPTSDKSEITHSNADIKFVSETTVFCVSDTTFFIIAEGLGL
jgi:hypothetical protein